jgi:hypothetical protein
MQGVGSVEIGGSAYFKLDSAIAVRARPGKKRDLQEQRPWAQMQQRGSGKRRTRHWTRSIAQPRIQFGQKAKQMV